ncbi:hypothetical protein P7C70_g7794, partial [Phenoliferia sp. Uapishka_3]
MQGKKIFKKRVAVVDGIKRKYKLSKIHDTENPVINHPIKAGYFLELTFTMQGQWADDIVKGDVPAPSGVGFIDIDTYPTNCPSFVTRNFVKEKSQKKGSDDPLALIAAAIASGSFTNASASAPTNIPPTSSPVPDHIDNRNIFAWEFLTFARVDDVSAAGATLQEAKLGKIT